MHGIPFVQIILTVAIALICWWIVERFSPSPLITRICQVIIFVVVLFKILPLLGLGG